MEPKPEPAKDQLQTTQPGTFDTDTLAFVGLRGDSSLHLSREALERALAALPPAPRDEGSVDLLLAGSSIWIHATKHGGCVACTSV